MAEEISKQEEARRILDAIRHKDNADTGEQKLVKPISHIPEEDANQLKELVAQKLKLKPDESGLKEELPDPDNIDPISTEQIKVMRKFASVHVEEKRPLSKIIIDGIIKGYFNIADSFTLKSDSSRRCLKIGHECAHCGQKIPFTVVEQYLKTLKSKEAASTDDKSTAEPSSETK